MGTRSARAEWTGDFRAGQGVMTPGSAAFEAEFSRASIHQTAPGSNPIEILGTSLAGCFTGGLAASLTGAGFAPNRISTEAEVHVDPPEKGYSITKVCLYTRADVPGLDEATLSTHAERMLRACPVGKALGSIEITLETELG